MRQTDFVSPGGGGVRLGGASPHTETIKIRVVCIIKKAKCFVTIVFLMNFSNLYQTDMYENDGKSFSFLLNYITD